MKIRNNKPALGKRVLNALNIAIFIVLALCVFPAEALQGKQQSTRNPVRYLVIDNDVIKSPAYESRDIGLMIDPVDFTPEQLRKLLHYLFKKYRTPKNMTVYLYSHPIQLRDSRLLEQIKPNDEAQKHPHGRLSRIEGKEVISYTVPPSRDRITIVVRARSEPSEK